MPAKDLTFFEKLKGKRYGDIELEAEGEMDPRLKGRGTREAVKKVRSSMEALKKFREQNKAASGY